MKPGAILTEREADRMLDRFKRIDKLTTDRRIKEHCRQAQLTIKAGIRRADKYKSEKEGLLFRLKSIL